MKVKFEFHHLRHKWWWHGNFYPLPTLRFAWDREEGKCALVLLLWCWRFDMWFHKQRKEDGMKK